MLNGIWRVGVAAAWALVITSGPAFAQVSFAGEWSGRYHEDQPDRVPGEEPGDFSGVPINEAARHVRRELGRGAPLGPRASVRAVHAARTCSSGPTSSASGRTRNPDTQELIAIEMYHRAPTSSAGRSGWTGVRTRPDYAPHTFMGFSTGEWNGDIADDHDDAYQAGLLPADRRPRQRSRHGRRALDAARQRALAGDHRHRPGVSERAVHPEPGVRADGARQQNWLYNCEYAMEVPRRQEQGAALPAGREPVERRVRGPHAHAARGRARRRRDAPPRMEAGRRAAAATRPNANGGFRPAVQPQPLPAGEVQAVHVQGNVYMIVGAGANIAVQVGEDGVSSSTPARPGRPTRCWPRSGSIAPGKEIRWIVNTTWRPITRAATRRCRRPAVRSTATSPAIVAHENAALRMIEARVPDAGAAVQHLLRGAARLPVQRRAGRALPPRVVEHRYATRW